MDYRLVLLLALAMTFTILLLSPQEASAAYCGKEGNPCVQGYKKCCNAYHCDRNRQVCKADSKKDSKKKNRNVDEAMAKGENLEEEMDRSVGAEEEKEMEEEEMDRSVDAKEKVDYYYYY